MAVPAVTPDCTTHATTDGSDPTHSHIVRRDDQIRGYVTGKAIVALCGKTWVPSRDPDRYPLCPRCKQTMDQLMAGRHGRN